MTKFEIELSDADLVYILNDKGAFGPYGAPEGQKIGRQIRDQLPPPRMAEPGWGEKVIASFVQGGLVLPRVAWVRFTDNPNITVQYTTSGGVSARWKDLIDPEPVDGAL
jgi:hypothetical protein